MEIDERVQAAKSKEGKYLTFAFFEKDRGMKLEFVGWMQLSAQRAQPEKHRCVKGIITPWGGGIPVIDLKFLHGRGLIKMTDTSCIVIFEYSEPYKHYFGIVVEELSNVFNIAEGTENKDSWLLLSAKKHLSSRREKKNWNPAIVN